MSQIDEAAVSAAVEAYRRALLASDKGALEAMCHNHLTYGHSSGLLQNRAEFIADATSGDTVWKSIAVEHPANRITGDIAVSRFIFNGENMTAGKVNTPHFGVVMVWHKEGKEWKMLVRQGYKI